MEAPMRVGWGVWGKISIIACCLFLALEPCLAQKTPSENPNSARSILIEKARALDARNRPDMAVQLWQQILLSDPNNAEALAGVARDYKLMGAADRANQALERLRRTNPNDPNIARIESLSSTQVQADQLRRAGELAGQGRAEDALQIYRDLYGSYPPDNDIGLAYYQTLYATATGKTEAVTGLRGLADRNPGNARYFIALGVMLTYDPRTRAEGIRILQAYPKDTDAQAALRKALIWNAPNPTSAPTLRQYLRQHPDDAEIASNLKSNELKLAHSAGSGPSAAERAAYAALNAHRLDEAQKRFDDLLKNEPGNGRAAAGMAFLHMQQQNFGAAIDYLKQAEKNGYKTSAVVHALETAQFWYTMSQAAKAFSEDRLDDAVVRYKDALLMKPRSPEALNGLAGALIRRRQYAAAASVYEQIAALQSVSPSTIQDAWRGLFLAYARDNRNEKALATISRMPAAVKAGLAKDPEYMRTLAAVYQAQSRDADAERVLAEALALPFPNNGSTLRADARLQYAGLLMDAKRYDQAVTLYTQVQSEDPGNVPASMGLVSAHHELGLDAQAIADVQKMPPATYESAVADAGFLPVLAAIYQQSGQYDVAQSLLEKSAQMRIAAGGQPTVGEQLQLAAIYLLRNDTDQAYAIYQRVISQNPENANAWKGLIGTLLATNRNAEALAEMVRIPASAKNKLENDVDFEQSEAALYASAGDLRNASIYMNRVQAHYAGLKTKPPASIDVQNAWLLYNIGNDRALYDALMRIGGRSDLTVAQRETVQDIWANWSVRRAAAAMDAGDSRRAVDILDAALQAFPDNLTVRKAVAGGYARVGRARDALKIYKAISLNNGTPGDYQGAIGAALAANDKTQAELWLRQALARFGNDPTILSMAARYEQAIGDNQRAAEYWRAALAAMPATAATDKLSHELASPEPESQPHRLPTEDDLPQLLNPDYDSLRKTTDNRQLFHEQSAIRSWKSSSVSGGWAMRDAVYHPSLRGGTAWTLKPAFGEKNELTQVQVQLVSQVQSNDAEPISPNPPRTMASDAWKGLILSLTAGNRNAEALAELAKIPPDVRRQLEADLEFVQGIASLYAAVGNSVRATEYLNRIENYYRLHGATALAALEIQHAWLLYNLKDDVRLYPVMLRLDARADLTAGQRDQVGTIWASWAVRRAQSAMESGNTQRGLQILETASRNYPNDMSVRSAMAGAYARVGRMTEALALFKTIPMDKAGTGDFEGAVSAAIGAREMTQAEAWLRQGLARYPDDPHMMALAARFEQARGDNQRAAEYWRQALTAMPAGTSLNLQDNNPAFPANGYKTSEVGDIKRLLDPQNVPPPAAKQVPLPSYNAPPAPATQNPQPADASSNPQPQSPDANGAGVTDQELEQRNLPPLRGPWMRRQREQNHVSPRQEAEMQLSSIEGGYSGWLAGTGFANYRSGALGFDRLAALEAPFEASAPMGYHARLTIVARPVFLDAGQADGTAMISVLRSTATGTALASIPEPIGTLTTTDVTPPAQQNATGIGGELQLAFPQFAIAGGYTPNGFLVSTFTGRMMWRPGTGPVTLSFVRDAERDSQLSYAGLRDPAAAQGQIWGGVVYNQGNLQFAHGDAQSGFYFNVGGQYLAGRQVQSNRRIDGNGGAYWRMMTAPEYGTLSIGVNFFAMHYANNQNAFTHGMGGYFSPQAYFLANVPFSFVGHYQTKWHYNVVGGFGVQAFNENKTPLWPLAADRVLQANQGNPMLPDVTSVGPNYDLHGQAAYQIGPHWFAGGFFSANNTRNYSAASVGFSIHYMFRAEPSTANGPTGLFPNDGLRPFIVP